MHTLQKYPVDHCARSWKKTAVYDMIQPSSIRLLRLGADILIILKIKFAGTSDQRSHVYCLTRTKLSQGDTDNIRWKN